MQLTSTSGNLDTNNEPFFKIDSISAVPVVLSDALSGPCGSRVALSQRFSIKFETSPNQQQSQFRSGNPGYIVGLPLLVGRKLDNAVEAYERGFMLRGGDAVGQCLSEVSDLKDFGDVSINFGEDIIYGCTKRLNLNDLQNYCNDQNNLAGQGIYKNLEFFEYFGQFGNADIYKI